MTIKWLGTTAIALLIATGAVIAQSPQEQKHEEGPRAQTPSAPSKDADRPAAGEERPAADRKDRAARPEPKAGAKEPQRGEPASPSERTKQSQEQTRRDGRASVTVNDQQRTQIIDRLRRERSASNENINIRVNVGERLPANVRPRPLPPDIVRIAPQYRDYEYTVVDNRFVFVDPRSREVVDIIDEPGSMRTSRVERDRV